MKSVLIAIEKFGEADNAPLAALKEAGIDVIPNDTGQSLKANESPELFKEADYIIAGLEKYSSSTFLNCPKLQCISRVGVGTDNIDLVAAKAAGVRICITSDKPSVAVAELCIGNMISLLRHTHEMSNDLKAGFWSPIQGSNLRSCTIGIVGLGSIGKELAHRLCNFGCNVISASRTWNDKFARENNVSRKTLDDLFSMSNIVSIHLPMDNETKNMISRELIRKMPSGGILVNTSRAGVVDNQAVVQSLLDGQLSGAAIDVFDDEPNPEPYSAVPNVILSPHIGSHTRETRLAMELMAVENIIAVEKYSKNLIGTDAKNLLSYLEQVTV
jgi:D-3-phosphoglycerate dehydrogenase